MKKKILILLFGILMLLSACGTQAQLSEGVERSDNAAEVTKEYIEETVETVETPMLTEDIESVGAVEEVIPEEAFDLSDKEPLDALKAVLLNKAPFIYLNSYGVSGKGTVYEEDRGYLEDVLEKHQILVTRFAIIDMDGDGISEIILEWGNCIGSVLLRYWDGKVLGKEFGYRAMGNIRDDGSFWQSNSGFETYISKLFFIGDSTFDDTIVEMDTRFEPLYYVHDVPVSEVEMQKVYDLHEEIPEIEWYEFSKEEICKRVSEWFESGEDMVISKERQEYLDTFSYLLELRKSSQSDGQEKHNEAAKRYYYNAIAEMESIYELYCGTLSGEGLEQLEADQQCWQASIDQRLVQSLYSENAYSIEELENWGLFFDQGDFYLTRACHLVNWYYGCRFYD